MFNNTFMADCGKLRLRLFSNTFLNFVHFAAAVKLVPLQPGGRKYYLVEAVNARILSTVNRKLKLFLGVCRIPNFGPSRKLQTHDYHDKV